jgi:pilus assembly protein CpaF
LVLVMRPDSSVVDEVRGAEAFELSRAVNAGCGFLCTIHANNAGEALHALVDAALVAGENVAERIVRKVFSQSLDLVVHLDRDDIPPNDTDGIRRQIMEIVAVVPALSDDFTVEPIFVRGALVRPLEWTGVLPARLEARVDRSLPGGLSLRAIVEGAEVAR